MNKRKSRRVQREPANLSLRGLLWGILSIPYNRMPNRHKLHSDLILQSGDERDADERCFAKIAFDRVSQFSAGALGIALASGPLKLIFPPSQMVDESACHCWETSANDREILPHRRVCDELADQRFAIGLGLGKQQQARGEPVDAVDNERPLSSKLKFRSEQRLYRRRIRTFDRYRQKSGGFIDNHDGVVFIHNGQFA